MQVLQQDPNHETKMSIIIDGMDQVLLIKEKLYYFIISVSYDFNF